MRLQELRIKNNISQEKLAKHLGLVRSSICQYEKGKRIPDYQILSKIADYFNVTVDYLLGRDEIPPKDKVLSTDEKAILDLFNQVPADKQDLVLQMIKVAIENSK